MQQLNYAIKTGPTVTQTSKIHPFWKLPLNLKSLLKDFCVVFTYVADWLFRASHWLFITLWMCDAVVHLTHRSEARIMNHALEEVYVLIPRKLLHPQLL